MIERTMTINNHNYRIIADTEEEIQRRIEILESIPEETQDEIIEEQA